MHHRDPAATTPTLRPAVRATLQALAVTAVLFASVPASAQDLPSRPIGWLSPLPAPPAAVYEAGPAREASGSFLKGRFLLGINLTHSLTPDEELGSHWSVAPVIRNTPRRLGWGPSFGLSGYKGDITAPIDGRRTPIGEVRIRPLMGGISYSIGGGRARTSFSFVGGYAFSSAKVTAALPDGAVASIDIENAWVVRPNVGLTYALTRRLALIGSIGYVYTNPTITINVSQAGQGPSRVSGSFRSDYVSITVGTAISIF